jgi:hypothetical protein
MARIDRKSIYIPLSFKPIKTESRTVEEDALADTGASGKFIDERYSKKLGLPRIPLKEPLDVYNVDGTQNKKGTITHYTRIPITIGERTTQEELMITGLGRQKIILGLPWFRENNPDIDWDTGKVKWRKPTKKIPERKVRTTPKLTGDPDLDWW